MSAELFRHMAKSRGRPKKPDDEGKRVVKLHADLVDMIAWIVRIRKETDPNYSAAELVDPLLRPQIKARYEIIKPDVEKIKKAQASASEKAGEEE